MISLPTAVVWSNVSTPGAPPPHLCANQPTLLPTTTDAGGVHDDQRPISGVGSRHGQLDLRVRGVLGGSLGEPVFGS